MKLEDAKDFINAHPNEPMAALWAPLLRDKWQEGLFEVQELLESITITDVGIWGLLGGGPELDAIAEGVTRKYKLNPAIVSDDLRRILGKQLPSNRKDILEKIGSFSDDRGLDMLDFLSEVKASTNLASQVQKNATKKGLYEPAAAAFIELRSRFTVFVLAHAETRLSIRFSDSGKVGINREAKDPYSKDADLLAFLWSGEKCHAYLISHKYARVGGGHQKNQRSDATKFLAYANEALNNGEKIPELRELVEKITGKSIAETNFSWEPALVLDGEYFANAPSVVQAEESYPKLRNTKLFIGDVDAFVSLAGN